MSLRKNIIALSLFNAASLLQEQAEAAPAPAPAPAPEPMPEVPPAGDIGAESPMDEQGKPITIDSIIDRMNIIRSGLSFEDPEVYGKLTTLFKKMSSEDKMKLNKQLTDIGAIVQNIPAEKQEQGSEEAVPPAAEAVPSPAAAPPPPPAPTAV